MSLDECDAFCGTLLSSFRVIQWGGAHVWKVGDAGAAKVFAIAGWNDDGGPPFVTFKCSPMSFDLLMAQPSLRPAPYLASRGMKWIQRRTSASMDDDALRDYLRESHRLAALNLSKTARTRLGLI